MRALTERGDAAIHQFTMSSQSDVDTKLIDEGPLHPFALHTVARTEIVLPLGTSIVSMFPVDPRTSALQEPDPTLRSTSYVTGDASLLGSAHAV